MNENIPILGVLGAIAKILQIGEVYIYVQGEDGYPLLFVLPKQQPSVVKMILANSQKNRQIIQQYIVIYNMMRYNCIMAIVHKNIGNYGVATGYE